MTVLAGQPFGSLDAVTRTGGTIRVAGWAIDPDTAAPIPVHVYVGSSGSATTADQSRTDLAAIYPGYGAAHGYVTNVPDPGGAVTVCAYAINVGGHRLQPAPRLPVALSERGRTARQGP